MRRQPECLVAVTGTNGKSSVVHFLRQIWRGACIKGASHGTVGLFVGDRKVSPEEIEIASLTTPDAASFRRILNFLKSRGVTHLAFEASSHGLVQRRVHEASLSAAAFTNFGSDHLDYHKTKESYLKAKLILFDEILERGRQAIVFGDQPEVRDSVAKLSGNIITFGMGKENFVRAKDVKCFPGKVLFDLAVDGYMIPNVEIGIFGEFQVLNVLCSVALSYACGLSVTRIVEALSGLSGLNGRMEMIAPYKGGAIYIDYAHTALGFQSALEAFRAGCQAKLICVFGCGGNRDRSKRGEMGRTACAIADAVIVTDDNPRDEDPAFIRSEILADCDERAIEIGDRNEAIRHAMTLIGEGDIIAIIGKGHEVGQIYGNAVIPQNDKDEILKIIANEIKSTVLHV